MKKRDKNIGNQLFFIIYLLTDSKSIDSSVQRYKHNYTLITRKDIKKLQAR